MLGKLGLEADIYPGLGKSRDGRLWPGQAPGFRRGSPRPRRRRRSPPGAGQARQWRRCVSAQRSSLRHPAPGGWWAGWWRDPQVTPHTRTAQARGTGAPATPHPPSRAQAQDRRGHGKITNWWSARASAPRGTPRTYDGHSARSPNERDSEPPGVPANYVTRSSPS